MKDLTIEGPIKPKFRPGQTVFRVRRAPDGTIYEIRPIRIRTAVYTAKFLMGGSRKEEMVYLSTMSDTAPERELIASLDELSPKERNPGIFGSALV